MPAPILVHFTPHTWQDDLAANGVTQKTPTHCCGCNRSVEPFELIKTEQVDNDIIDHDWVCTGCANEAVRAKKITKKNLVTKLKKIKENHV